MFEAVTAAAPNGRDDVARVVTLTPAPSVLSALGRGHSMQSAIADLIDNALDKAATRIAVRFMVRAGFVESIRISDDGEGMTEAQLLDAMTVGKRREYRDRDLGHFGMGLKSASMSQCSRLEVFTKHAGDRFRGARMLRDDVGGGFAVDVLTESAAWAGFHRGAHRGIESTGTVIEWSSLDGVSVAAAPSARQRWLDDLINTLRNELGLTFHRLIASGDVRIEIDEFDVDYDESGAPRVVEPVDPFDFHISGHSEYPTSIDAVLPGGAKLCARCHILPPGANGPTARIFGRSKLDWQGLYIYRNDRLLQAGGWLSLRPDHRADWQLARVAIDLDDSSLKAIAINPEKRGVVLRPDFVQALEAGASAAGITFDAYLEHARDVVQAANARRASGPKPVTPISRGLPAASLEATRDLLGDRSAVEPVTIKWRALDEDRLFQFDHPARTLWMNAGYRRALTAGDGLAHAVFLLVESHFAKERPQQGTLDQIEAWQRVLATTVIDALGRNAFDPVGQETSEAEALSVFDSGEVVTRDAFDGGDPDHPPAPTPADLSRLLAVRAADTQHDVDAEHRRVEVERDRAERYRRAARRGEVTIDGESLELLRDTAMPSDDPISDLRRKLGRYPLLDAAEEVELAKQIEAGVLAQDRLDAMGESERNGRLRRELQQLVVDGRRAFDRFAGSNLRLVFSIAATRNHRGLEYPDLVQEGMLGMLHAIEKFDFMAGTKFSTYATWWIRQSIDRALADTGRQIRIPVHMVERQIKISTFRRRFEIEHGREPTQTETAAGCEVPVEEISKAQRYEYRYLSLEHEVNVDGHGTRLSDLLVDESAIEPIELVEAADLVGALNAAVVSAPDRQATVLVERFGLDGSGPKTLDQIGDSLGVTRERIRQIEKKALERLRSPRFSYLREHLSDFDFARVGIGALDPINQEVPDVVAPVPPMNPAPTQAAPSQPAVTRAQGFISIGDRLRAYDDRTAVAPTAVRDLSRDSHLPDVPADARGAASIVPNSAAHVVDLYRRGATLHAIEVETDRPAREIVNLLGALLLGLDSDPDDASLAPRHGLPWEPSERERVLAEFRRGVSATRIAESHGRTPLAIAWQLLDSPRRPVSVPKKLVRDLRRNAGDLANTNSQAG